MATQAPQVAITLLKGFRHEKSRIQECIRVLGLHRIGQTVVRPDSPVLRGLIRKTAHLVKVERPS